MCTWLRICLFIVHAIQLDVPLENIFSMIDAAIKYGKYSNKINLVGGV